MKRIPRKDTPGYPPTRGWCATTKDQIVEDRMAKPIGKYFMDNVTWSRVWRDIYNSRPVGWSVLRREIAEIFEEIFSGEFRAAWVEVTQCWYYLQLIGHQMTGLDWTPIGVSAVLKDFYDRLVVWKEIFDKEELEFNVDYLVGGSNYNRPEKVASAIALARKAQSR